MSRLQVSRDVVREEGSAQARTLEAVVEYQTIHFVREDPISKLRGGDRPPRQSIRISMLSPPFS